MPNKGWKHTIREWKGDNKNNECARLYECVCVFKLPATLVRTCMFSSSTARGSRYSAALPASTSVSLLFTWLRRSRYSLHTNICVTMAISKSRGKLDKKNQFQSYWSFRSVNCFSRLDISSRHSILLRSQSSSSISGTWWRHTKTPPVQYYEVELWWKKEAAQELIWKQNLADTARSCVSKQKKICKWPVSKGWTT